MKFEVIVELKQEVLDPQGRAIRQTLVRLGKDQIKDIRASKRFVIDMGSAQGDLLPTINEIAMEFLANPVSEVFTVRRLDS
jgi:phosphoribosylformylglycinamidine synthase PurS subunit